MFFTQYKFGQFLAGCILLLTLLVTAVLSPAAAQQAPPNEAQAVATGDEQWDDQFGYPGVSGTVNAIAVDGDDVYVGGDMLKAGGVASGAILRWDGRRWHELGDGVTRPSMIFGEANGSVKAIAVANGKVYVGGQFHEAGSVEASNIAVWDGQSWSALGDGIKTGTSVDAATVNAIVVVGDDVYVGGNFGTAGATAADSVARWNTGSGTWSALGSGLGGAAHIEPRGTAQAIVAGPDGIYVSGQFHSAGGVAANSIARWNPTTATWAALGQGLTSGGYRGDVFALAVSGNKIYAGGWFDKAGTTAAANVAAWDSTAGSWSAVGGGVDDVAIMGQIPVLTLAVDGSRLYAGGHFTTAGGATARRIAQWNGSGWQPLVDNGAEGAIAGVHALALQDGDLYAGGEFLSMAGKNVSYIGRWDGVEWFALGQGVEVYGVHAIAVNRHGHVYAGGLFSYAGGVPVNNIARWDGRQWHPLGSGVEGGAVKALVAVGDDLYVGGRFIKAGGQAAYYVARWNETAQSWSALGQGLGYDVEALALSGTTLYVGGHFVTAGGELQIAMARYDLVAGQWSGLGNRLFIDDPNGDVYAIVTQGDYVFIGGSFATVNYDGAGSIPANGLLIWNSAQDEWATITDGGYVGVGAFAVRALALHGDDLYVGGSLYSAGPVSTSGVARYNFSSGRWSALGAGLDGGYPEVYALYSDGTSVYIGGSFDTAGGLATDNVARWDPAAGQWAALGSGAEGRTGPVQENDPLVNALAASGGDLYVGGVFLRAGGLPSHSIARWVATSPAQTTAVTTASGGTLTTPDMDVHFAPGAVAQDVTVHYTPLAATSHLLGDGQTSLRSWALEARTADGRLVSQFQQPYTLTVRYTDDEVAVRGAVGGVDENNLTLAYWNGAAWVNLLPCAGCSVDTDNNVITVVADHFTEFALLVQNGQPAPGTHILYLPLLME